MIYLFSIKEFLHSPSTSFLPQAQDERYTVDSVRGESFGYAGEPC